MYKPLFFSLFFPLYFFYFENGRRVKEEWEPVSSPGKWRGVLFSRLFLLVSDFWSWVDGNVCLSWFSSHTHYLHLGFSLLLLSPANMCLQCYAVFFRRKLLIMNKSNKPMPQSRAELKCSEATKISWSFSFKSTFCFLVLRHFFYF